MAITGIIWVNVVIFCYTNIKLRIMTSLNYLEQILIKNNNIRDS